MVLAIPGGRGLFPALQRALRRTTGRIRLTQAVHDELDDWRWLTRDIHSQPTSWDELVEKTPAYVGSNDACQNTVWVVYGLEITRQTNLHCGDRPFHQKLLRLWLPTKTPTVQFPTRIWSWLVTLHTTTCLQAWKIQTVSPWLAIPTTHRHSTG